MDRRLSSVVPILLLCLSLAACGESVATRAVVAQATPSPTSTPVPPTSTLAPPTATSVPPTATPVLPTFTPTPTPRATATVAPGRTPTATRPTATTAQTRPTATVTRTRTPTPTPLPVPEGVVAVPDMGARHVNEGQPLVIAHSPPSSGTHYLSPLRAGIYRQEASPGYWVHNLEHGYVVALVRCSADCDALFAQLQEIYATRLRVSMFGNVKFVATTYSDPLTNGEAQVAVVAWGYELLLPTLDADRIVSFYERFVDQGPEAIP
jgi:hypothetical protein